MAQISLQLWQTIVKSHSQCATWQSFLQSNSFDNEDSVNFLSSELNKAIVLICRDTDEHLYSAWMHKVDIDPLKPVECLTFVFNQLNKSNIDIAVDLIGDWLQLSYTQMEQVLVNRRI